MHGAGPFSIAFDLKYSTLTQFWHMAGVHDNSGRKYMVLSEGGVSHTGNKHLGGNLPHRIHNISHRPTIKIECHEIIGVSYAQDWYVDSHHIKL